MRLAAAVAGATLSLSCGVPGTSRAGDDLTNAAARSETAARPSVKPPGPLDQPLAGDDLLVVSDHTLPARVIDRILAITVDGIRGVTASEQFSIAQFSAENQVYDVAAVDPGGFRRFAGEDADFTAQWRRIAAGEVAVTAQSADQLPLDDQDYLAIGTGRDQQRLHVGAYSRHQTGTIDALVNAPWGKQLGMPDGNALLLSTGAVAPQAVRAQIRKLAPDLSITALDIVAETGIDPGARQSVTFVGTFADAVGDFRYTATDGGRVVPDPTWERSHIVTESVPILGRVTCNKYLMPQLRGALAEVQASGLAASIHPSEYAGCYYPRFIAGTNTLSNHAFGLALDMNVPGNLRGTAGDMDRAVVAVFKRWGFAWGGDWNYTDPMHFELLTIVSPNPKLQ